MKIVISVVAATLALGAMPTCVAADTIGPLFKTIGLWDVHRLSDPMTDKPICVALYKADDNIQLSEKSLGIWMKGRGGVSLYQYRLDTDPPIAMRLASRVEGEISAVIVEGDEFNEMIKRSRVRFNIVSMLTTSVYEDIDLINMTSVIGELSSSECNAS